MLIHNVSKMPRPSCPSFIYSLDNLPNEVAYLLQEIKEKEIKVQDLQAEIDTDSSRVSPSPRRPACPSPKSTLIPGKISTAYAKIDKLSAEKCALAQRIIDLVSRTRTRLDSGRRKGACSPGRAPRARLCRRDHDRKRQQRTPPAHALGGGLPMLEGEVYVGASRNPASQIRESLHHGPRCKHDHARYPDASPPSAMPVAAFASVSAGCVAEEYVPHAPS
ncbi:hypothetical protein B0H14DRAFT_3893031 [Mycena olivaceomarginata]|nr:hypothetical protein B0H14DRAFT_3893031 [Mycena olivaceomarginata]